MHGNDDNWDNVVNYEANEFNLGVQEGIVDGKESGFRLDGHNAGFIKGYTYGIELGFYEAAVNHYLNTASPLNASTDRIDKRAQQLLQKLSNIKSVNDSEIDYDSEIQSIRSLYKSLNLSIGSFLSITGEPIANIGENSNESHSNVQNTKLSW